MLPVSRADGGSNLAITRGQYALAAQTEAGKAIVTIATDLSGSADAYQMCRTARLAGRSLPVRPAALTKNTDILILDIRAVPAMLPSSTACQNRGEWMIEL